MGDKIKQFAILVVLYTAVIVGVGAFVLVGERTNDNVVEYQQF